MYKRKTTIADLLGRRPVHPFPARMAPEVALGVLKGAKKPLRVLDPMMGSGTVMAFARAKGHRAIGLDIDPLAVLISKVWTAAISPARSREKARQVLRRARLSFANTTAQEAYPSRADAETRKFLTYWFDSNARRQLWALASAIEAVRAKEIRDVLWCGFSRLIITKQAGCSLAMDLAHSRPHKSYDRAPVEPFRKFLPAIESVVENCVSLRKCNRGPAPMLRKGDARSLFLGDCSVDLVLTSPPYLNAIDYMRCSKFSLVWMGYTLAELRELRNKSVGTEAGWHATDHEGLVDRVVGKLRIRRRLGRRHLGVLRRYVHDIHRCLTEASRVLVPGGRAVYVVGENTIKGTFIRNSSVVISAATASGLSLSERRTRRLPPNRRYLPPPSTQRGRIALNTRMRREVVLIFRKPVRRNAGASRL